MFTTNWQWQMAWVNKVLPGRGILSAWTPAKWTSPGLIIFASVALLKTLQVEQDTMICCPVPGEQTIKNKRGERRLWNVQHIYGQLQQNKNRQLAHGYMKQRIYDAEGDKGRGEETGRKKKLKQVREVWGQRLKCFLVWRGYEIYAVKDTENSWD